MSVCEPFEYFACAFDGVQLHFGDLQLFERALFLCADGHAVFALCQIIPKNFALSQEYHESVFGCLFRYLYF